MENQNLSFAFPTVGRCQRNVLPTTPICFWNFSDTDLMQIWKSVERVYAKHIYDKKKIKSFEWAMLAPYTRVNIFITRK